MSKKLIYLASMENVLNLEVCKMYSIRAARKVSLFRDCVLAVLLSVVCSLLTAMPAAYAGDRYALDFDGVDDYVDVPTTEYIFEDEHVFTIELWGRWFDDTRSLCSNRYHMQRSRFRTRGSAALTVRTQIQDDEWYHVAVVYDGSGATKYLDLYVDGVQTDSTSTTGSPLSSYEGDPLRFGMTRHSDGQYSNCIMDDVRIWNKGRAQSEIQKYMNLELFGGEEGLVGYWKFNEAEGTTAYDSSPNQNHGTIVGATWTADAAPIVAALPLLASSPGPAAGATDVPRDVVLSWMPGAYAAPINGHKVYFGENFNDVNDGIGGIAQSATSYAPPQRLDFSKTYYWRVDEVNGPPDFTVYEGRVWSFTTELLAYPVENVTATASSSDLYKGPENTVNGAGLDDSGLLHGKEGDSMWLSSMMGPQPTWIEYEFDGVYKLYEMWVWNSNDSLEPAIGFGFKDVTIEYSVNGTDYTTLGTTHQFARAPGLADYAHNTTVDLSGAAARYVRLTANSNWGGFMPQYGLSEVRFFSIPVFAREPSPDSGATDVDVDVVLSWRAGREAAQHDVYLSTDEQAVIDGNAPVVTTTEASYGPLSPDLGMTYYWKINEVNMAETPAVWQGELWNFRAQEYFVVDDFEAYNDLDPTDPKSNRIFLAWLDGYGVPINGSLVGYDVPPFAEQSIVYSGKQAMPFFYDNSGTARNSEAELTLSPAQDWTKHGITVLSLQFCGDPNNAVEQMYVEVNGSKVVYDGDAADIRQAWWQQWNIDLASFGASLQNVTKLSIGFGDETSMTPGGSGVVYVDDIRLYRSISGPPAGIWIEAEAADSITEPMKIYDDPRASGGQYIGTTDDVGNSSDSPPSPAGTATYTFTVEGGTYKVSCSIIIPSGDSFWVRIPGATTQTTNHSSGWVKWSDPDDSDNWYWADVFSDDDDENATVLFTLPAGTHTLEIGYREDGALMDAIVISKID